MRRLIRPIVYIVFSVSLCFWVFFGFYNTMFEQANATAIARIEPALGSDPFYAAIEALSQDTNPIVDSAFEKF